MYSGLFLFSLAVMDQVRSGLSLQDMPSKSHDSQHRVVEISAGASFSEPTSELLLPSSRDQKVVRRVDHEHLTPLGSGAEDSAEARKVTYASLEVSADAGFSELPSQGQKIMRSRDHEHLMLEMGPEVGAEVPQMTPALLDVAKADSTSLTAIQTHAGEHSVNRARIDTVGGFIVGLLLLILILVIVFLVTKLMKAQLFIQAQGRLAREPLVGNESTERGQGYASRRSKAVTRAQIEDEAAVKIQTSFRDSVKRKTVIAATAEFYGSETSEVV